jgi:hypothetical protein
MMKDKQQLSTPRELSKALTLIYWLGLALRQELISNITAAYLALEESYLPLRAAVPSYPTLFKSTLYAQLSYGAITLYGPAFKEVR